MHASHGQGREAAPRFGSEPAERAQVAMPRSEQERAERANWEAIPEATHAGPAGASRVIAMCGSGVTACHNLLALELAGLPEARLYAGSWSEWIRDPRRPVARGAADED